MLVPLVRRCRGRLVQLLFSQGQATVGDRLFSAAQVNV
jgi:hypothetical protein